MVVEWVSLMRADSGIPGTGVSLKDLTLFSPAPHYFIHLSCLRTQTYNFLEIPKIYIAPYLKKYIFNYTIVGFVLYLLLCMLDPKILASFFFHIVSINRVHNCLWLSTIFTQSHHLLEDKVLIVLLSLLFNGKGWVLL